MLSIVGWALAPATDTTKSHPTIRWIGKCSRKSCIDLAESEPMMEVVDTDGRGFDVV